MILQEEKEKKITSFKFEQNRSHPETNRTYIHYSITEKTKPQNTSGYNKHTYLLFYIQRRRKAFDKIYSSNVFIYPSSQGFRNCLVQNPRTIRQDDCHNYDHNGFAETNGPEVFL